MGLLIFLRMGGYAAFVWPAFGFTLCVLGLNLWLPWRQSRKLRQHASDSQT